MTARKAIATILFSVLATISFGRQEVPAQGAASSSSQEAKVVDETNLDTQLYLLVATNQELDDSKLPAALDSVVKQLRSSLPFKNYKLMTTLVNRVKNEGRLSLSGLADHCRRRRRRHQTRPASMSLRSITSSSLPTAVGVSMCEWMDLFSVLASRL